MKHFEDQTDVEDWLAPLSYEEFWKETAPFALDIPPRAACDYDIRAGAADEACVLSVLKAMARLQIIDDLKLPNRDHAPWMNIH